jgi:uncharacterized protein
MSLERRLLLGALITATIGVAIVAALPTLAAGGLLYPTRHHVNRLVPENCEDATFNGLDVTLKGWRCHALTHPRGTIIYLHGVADNRASATGVIQRFVSRGFDVVAYDSRAHGESTGEICTYGYFEKQDLRRVIDSLGVDQVALAGTSLGAAVALQEAADDTRVYAVVAAEPFSDLQSIVRERAPFFLTETTIQAALRIAEERGRFKIDAVNPADAAARIKVPVLLIHGADDRDTPPAHSERIYSVLNGPKRLILVPGAHHNESLNNAIWPVVDLWLENADVWSSKHIRDRPQ